MKTRVKAGLLGGVIAGGVAGGLTISLAGAQKPDDRPLFRTSTTAAVVDVIVRDRSGRPVQGLTEEDFEILEDGIQQRIISFESHTPHPHIAREKAGEDLRRPAQRAAPVDGPTQSLVALVFHNLSHQSRAMAVKAARSTIEDLLPDEYGAVFVVDLGLHTMASFTRNKRELQEAVNRVLERAPVSLGSLSAVGVAETNGPTGPLRSAEDRQFADMRERLQGGLELPHQQAVQATSLSGLITQISRFAGRKSVILLSEGLAVSARMDGVLQRAQEENVSFYTIGAAGLGVSGRKAMPYRELDSRELTGSSQIRRASWQKSFPEMDPTAGLGPLADRTGGFLVSDTNDLTAAFSAVNADRRAFYVLAYSSRRETGDDPARHLEVRVKRPGLSVRARSGVFAAQPEAR
jgi:VWFA-related protein